MPNRSSKILHGATPEQAAAILHTNGPAYVTACPGAGKTRVITHRVANLVDHYGPEGIVAVTFTKKATAEMQKRITKLIGGRKSRSVHVATFHAYCAKQLRHNPEPFKVPHNYAIADQADTNAMVKQAIQHSLMHDAHGKVPADIISLYVKGIEKQKRLLIKPQQMKFRKNSENAKLHLVYQRYQTLLKRSNSIDFNDMLFYMVDAFNNDQELRKLYADTIRFLLVDEFQDTNDVQFHLINHLASVHRNVMVVGDPLQSIYCWRGAVPEVESQFLERYPEAKIYRLQQNFRSRPEILAPAEALTKIIKVAVNKDLIPTKQPSRKRTPRCVKCYNNYNEGQFIMHEIGVVTRAGKAKPSDFAVLYRKRSQSGALEEAAIHQQLPYKIVGGTGFYQRWIVKLVFSYLKWFQNPNNDNAFTKIYNEPRRGFGSGSYENAAGLCPERTSMWQFLNEGGGDRHLSKRAYKAFGELQTMLADMQDFIADNSNNVAEIVEVTLARTGINDMIDHIRVPEKKNEYHDYVRDLVGAAHHYYEQTGGTIADFIEHCALMSANDESAKNCVLFMTVHAAKGLEFKNVYVVGFNDGTMPLPYRGEDIDEEREEHIQEEIRIVFVAMTRAEERLTFTYPQMTSGYSGEPYPVRISPFFRPMAPFLKHGTWNSGSKQVMYSGEKVETRQLQPIVRPRPVYTKSLPDGGASEAIRKRPLERKREEEQAKKATSKPEPKQREKLITPAPVIDQQTLLL